MEWDKRAPSTSYRDGRASERGRGARESVRERERSVRGSERERDRDDYSDTGTVKQSHYPKPRASSRRPKDRSEGYTAKGFDNRGGPPPSRSATYGFADPFTAPSVAPSIASISTRGHKSGTVVGREVYMKDRLYGIDNWDTSSAAVEEDRAALELRHGSLSRKERDNRIENFAQNSVDNAVAGPAPSYAPTVKSRASRATHDTRDTRDTGYTTDTRGSRGTRESRPQRRAESVNSSSRVPLDRHSRASSAAPRDRIPMQGGASFQMTSSTTMIMSNSNANDDDIHIHSHRRRSSYISPGNGGGQLNMAQTSGFVSHSGDTHFNSRPSRGRNAPDMIVDYSQAGIQRIRPGDSIGSDTARHRPLTLLPSQPKVDRRIEDLGSVTASDASKSTIKPRRRKESVGDWPFENYDSGARTVTGSEASRLGRPPASSSVRTGRTGHTERTGRTGRTEDTGRSHNLRGMYLDNEPSRADPSVALSSRTQSTLRPPPSLYSDRSNQPPSTTATHMSRLARDNDLRAERDRYHKRD